MHSDPIVVDIMDEWIVWLLHDFSQKFSTPQHIEPQKNLKYYIDVLFEKKTYKSSVFTHPTPINTHTQ